MRKILAVAQNTLRECFRSRLTIMMLVLLAAAVFLIPQLAGRGTLLERLQIILDYSFTASAMLLTVLTILLGCGMLCGEIRNRYIFTPLTKPVARWQYLLGRWLGLVVLQTIIVVGFGSALYGITWYLRSQISDESQLAEVNDELLIARAQHSPVPLDLAARVQARLKLLAEDNRLQQAVELQGGGAEGEHKVLREITRDEAVQAQTAGPYQILRWHFEGLQRPADKNAMIQFTFKANASRSPPSQMLSALWVFERSGENQRPYVWQGDIPVATQKTLSMPAAAIGDDGRMVVSFQNLNADFPTNVTIYADEVRILYPVGGFLMNFIRGLALVLCLQMFLAAVAIVAGSFLSLPVASMVSFGVIFFGTLAGFIVDGTNINNPNDSLTILGYYTSVALLWLLPAAQTANPADALVGGIVIEWRHLLFVAGRFLVLQAGLTLAIGFAIFRRRELAQAVSE